MGMANRYRRFYRLSRRVIGVADIIIALNRRLSSGIRLHSTA